MTTLGRFIAILRDAIGHFVEDDGAAIASHVALSILMALFPFMIFLTALAGFFGTEELSAQVTELLFDAWPEVVAAPIARQVEIVLLSPRGDILTFGAMVALFLASNGVEAFRVALNRAYRVSETRNFLILRLQSFVFVLLGALGLLSLAFLIVLGPILWHTVVDAVPPLEGFQKHFVFARFGIGISVLFVALVLAHFWLPAGRRRLISVLPGIGLTLCLWMAGGLGFSAYLQNFASYTATYAGLASVMIAIVFLYLASVAFILGAEVNASIMNVETETDKAATPR
ncbi:MAG: YihY/virulence factor BrkB family protein [Pseudomonadota bacterium]